LLLGWAKEKRLIATDNQIRNYYRGQAEKKKRGKGRA